jgi:hypothetical protein
MKNILILIGFVSVFAFYSCEKDGEGGGDKNQPLLLECNPSGTLVLKDRNPLGVDYIVDCEFYMESGELVIEPGTTIQFNDGASMGFYGNATVRAIGTSENPIRFTNRGISNPSWAGIFIRTNGIGSEIRNCIIEKAGAGRSFGNLNPVKSAITIENTSVSISNNQIVDFGESGVLLLEDANVPSFSNNTVRNGSGYPVIIYPNLLGKVDLSLNTYTNNSRNFIYIEGTNVSYNENDELTTLNKTSIPYYIGKTTYTGHTIINAGVEMVFGPQGNLFVNGTNARLEIKGTAADHVIMRGETSGPGRWGGILVGGVSDRNELNYLDISDGGGSTLDHGTLRANLKLASFHPIVVTANNCTFTRSGSCDVVLDNAWNPKTFNNNNSGVLTVCEE